MIPPRLIRLVLGLRSYTLSLRGTSSSIPTLVKPAGQARPKSPTSASTVTWLYMCLFLTLDLKFLEDKDMIYLLLNFIAGTV